MNKRNELVEVIDKCKDMLLIVEGKRDASALQALGFSSVFILNEHSGSLIERVERIASSFNKEKEVCLLFDNDTAGRYLIAQAAPILHELGIHINQTLRRTLIQAGLSHVEGLTTFLKEK